MLDHFIWWTLLLIWICQVHPSAIHTLFGEPYSWYARVILLQYMEHPTMKCCLGDSHHEYLETMCSAIAKLDVKPGDSIPNKLTSPGIPWISCPCSRSTWSVMCMKNKFLELIQRRCRSKFQRMIPEKHLNDKIWRRLSRTRKFWSDPRVARFQRPILQIWKILPYHRVKYRILGGVHWVIEPDEDRLSYKQPNNFKQALPCSSFNKSCH